MSRTDRSSCPDACALKASVCYAEYGRTRIHWDRLDSQGLTLSELVARVRALEPGAMFRHDEAGDLPGVGDTLDVPSLAQLVEATAHTIAWTYTHKPLRRAVERQAVHDTNALGLMAVNLSADRVEDVDRLAALGVGPVVTVSPTPTPKAQRTAGGVRVVRCPAADEGGGYTAVTCATCGDGSPLCARSDRDYAIAFPVHGAGKGKLQ